MIGAWLRAHRSLVATATSGTVIAAVIATVAIVSSGYTAQKMDLGDGSVWVANSTQQVIGRANPAVVELNTVVRSPGTELSVVQSGSTVLLVDHADATVSIVDPATSTAGRPIALPPEQPQVFLAGDRVAIYGGGTGQLWLLSLSELQGFDATSTSTLSLGARSVVSVSPDGELVAYSPDTGQVYSFDAATSDEVESHSRVDLTRGSSYQVAAIGSSWAVLDTRSRRLVVDGRDVDLSGLIASGTDPVLQQSSAASDRLLVASDRELVSVPLGGGEPTRLVTGRSGSAAAPLVLDGCSYAAWTSGDAWRVCGGSAPETRHLEGMPGAAQLTFVANTKQVVLNDTRGGASWAVQHGGELIDNWSALITKTDDQQQQESTQDTPPDVDPEQKPPVAIDDQFGARPGRTTALPVLLNDYDPNADVLVITAFDQVDESVGRVDLVSRSQQLQLTLNPGVPGPVSFGYTISDGRGGTASATVTVTVRSDSENSPPQQVRVTTTTGEVGGRVSTQVSGDWVDPDGDPFYLTSATTVGSDRVSYKPEGVVVFSDSGDGETRKTVTLTMSDGRAQGSGSLSIATEPAGEVPLVVEPWFAPATAGQQITVRPLSHVRGGDGTIRLNAVPAKPGSTVVPSFEAGTFTFVSDEVGTHYVDFTVTDGVRTATGLMRIDVAPPPDGSTRPITVPHTIFVTALSSDTVDPTTTDIDPAGGVLVVTGLENVPANSGVQAEVLDQREVRVTLTRPLDAATVVFDYRISNGLADAVGTITVVEIPQPAQLQPPIAVDDAVTVRVGDAIDIPVLDNDEQPDGKPITLVSKLAQPLPPGAGLLFASGDRLRYLAPRTAGNYSAVYSVAGPDGQTAQAKVSISVREINASTNNPPVAARVTARVLAGETVKIPIPLTGIDPDGDSVSLIGVSSNPQKGSVLAVDADGIEYNAGDYSSGTDSFTYSIVDGLGARAQGTIRVGISPRLDGARNPVANADGVEVRPGRTVSVQVLANDSDPDGSPLEVTKAVPNAPGITAKVVDGATVDITPPKTAGSYAVIYTIQNQYGGTSSNFVTVRVDPTAPLAYPVVRDSVLSVSDVINRDTVDVPVLDNVFFADGAVSSLGISLLQGYSSSAQVLPNKKIRVKIGAQSQIIPFSVSHPDDDSVRSYGFIRVPGSDDALPQLDGKASPLVVTSEQTLRIDLRDYVVALAGSNIRLTDRTSVKATHADGNGLVADTHTLVFTSAPRYFGPASITFEVTDGSDANGGAGRTAILTLPIDVKPRDNQPPDFIGGVIDFEPGQSKELDLVKLTNYPYPDVSELAYTLLDPAPTGFSVALNGQRLTLTAHDDAVKGASTSVSLGVKDAINDGQSGIIKLQVVPSTRPLARPVDDRVIARRGTTTTVDVLTNDQANNPFPATPLRVIDVRSIDGAPLPPGVTVTPNADRSRLTVAVSDDAEAQDTTLQYEVADATADADRDVYGTITISVQDAPDPVTDLHVSEFGDRYLKLSWLPGQFNNSSITSYSVTMSSSGSGSVLSTTACTTTVGCSITTPGNGPSNAVRFSVVAVNAIGASTPTDDATPIWSDIIPQPPSGLGWTPLDGGLRVTWTKPADAGGSPIDQYVIKVGGVVTTKSVDPSDPVGTGYSANVQAPSISNGSEVDFSVSARNSAPNSLATWNSAQGSGIPAGPPTRTGSPSASASVTDGSTADIDWTGAFGSNGAAISRYFTVITTGDVPVCTVTGVDTGNPQSTPPSGSRSYDATASSAHFTGLSANQSYSITVYADNGQGCTASPTVTVTPRAAPGTVAAITPGGPDADGDGLWDFHIDGFTINSGSTDADQYEYRYVTSGVDGSTYGPQPTGDGHFLSAGGTQYGKNVSVQVKACKQYETLVCSANWSTTFHLGVPVDNSVPGGLHATVADTDPVATGDWSWGDAPSGAYTSVKYNCGGGWQTMPNGPGSCHATGGPLSPPAALQVRITANRGQTYLRSYSWNDFD